MIMHSGLPPAMEELSMHFTGRACGEILNLYVGYDKRVLAKCSRDLISQLCHGPVVTYCIVYHYTKKVTLARLLANKGPAIYVVHLNRYFVIPP